MDKKLETLEITRLFISDKRKDGTPIVDFSGRPAKKVSIKTKQYPDKWLYSFPTSKPDDPLLVLAENTTIEAITWEFNGYMNFKFPTRLDLLEERVIQLELQMRVLIPKAKPTEGALDTLDPTEKDPEFNEEDLPF